MGNSLFREIQKKRSINILIAFLAVLVLAVSSYFLYSKVFRAYADPVNVVGDTITFNSGYYTIDSSGNVYAKTGSEIADTPDDIYPFVSYLSDAYTHDGSQLSVYGKSVTVAGTATVVMEGHQTFSDLTLTTGGTVTQPQPDRDGYVNRYQYSDQEWAMEFLGFVKVPDGETRKVTCATDYDTGDGGSPIGNGCLIQYHPTETDLDDIVTGDWTDLDKVWQTGAAAFTTTRYAALGSITNASGSDKYYPLRVIFKDDFIDERDENMEVYLRNAAGTIIDQAGSDISAESPNSIEFANNTIYGASTSGTVDVSDSGEMRFQYYLLDEYIATVASQALGWISDDLTDAYKTYTNNETILSSFFDDGYGEDKNGFFDLKFDDDLAWDGTYASSPFAKGTTGAADEEAYKNYAYSAKTINPNISAGSTARYEKLGIGIVITSGALNFNGGIIDLSGKGYPGYSYEMRTQLETSTFQTNDGAGPDIDGVVYGGGDTADVLAQAGAHTTDGGGYDSNAYGNGANSSIYDNITGPIYAGSGGGSSGSVATSSHGGNGGGYLRISADNIQINSPNTAIDVDGDGGYQVAGGSNNLAGGSGGSVYLTANTLNNSASYGSGQFFAESDGGSNNTGTRYAGGAGGLIRIVMAHYQVSGTSSDSADSLSSATSMDGGDGNSGDISTGSDGERYIVINASLINTLDPDNPSKGFTVGGETTTSVQAGDTGQLAVTVNGILDETYTGAVPLDLVVVSDLSGSMEGTKLDSLKRALTDIIQQVRIDNSNGITNTRLGLVSFKGGFVDFRTLANNDSTLDSYISYVNTYTASGLTNAGDGLTSAWGDLTYHGRSDAKKYVVLITDGYEVMMPCITDPYDEDSNGDTFDCDDPRIEDPHPDSPLRRMMNSGFGLISLGIGTYDYGTFLTGIGETARLPDYEGPVFYEVADQGEDLSESLLDALGQLSAQTSGMGFTFTEVLAPGILPNNVDSLVINSTVYGGALSCTEGLLYDPDIGYRTKIVCTVTSDMYDSDLYGDTSFDDYKFHFKYDISFSGAKSGLIDLDQNAICNHDDTQNGTQTYNVFPDSYVIYNPVGSYLGDNKIRTDAYCISVTPQTTLKKELSPMFRDFSGNIDVDDIERFNPYSLMKEDSILVTITASPIVPGVETIIKDELLNNQDYNCVYDTRFRNLSNPDTTSGTSSGDFVTFEFI